MLRSISADTEIHGVALGVILGPHVLPSTFPALSDRVADKDQIDVALLDSLVERLMTLHPVAVARHGDHRVIRLVLRVKQRDDQA